MSTRKKAVRLMADLIIVAVLAGAGYQYRAQLAATFIQGKEILFPAAPCSRPIKYSLGGFDGRFGITKARFIDAANQAAGIWNSALGKNLLEYSPDGALKINLVYDYRQQATAQLAKIGIVIKDDKSTYDTLKTRYDSLYATYTAEKADIQKDTDSYSADKAAYEQNVAYWNNQGGAPRAQFQAMEKTRLALNAEAQNINDRQKTFNELVTTLNSVVTVLNRLVGELNLNVKAYNTVGASTGEQFSEGEYIEDSSGKRINIYQFNDLGQLQRVLEHEFGHALGLQHVSNPKAIMYYLNEGTNETLTADDINELKASCKIR
ncbi:matrixin family metalloprotease [Patescibacteria group bacterium]|nr:matrixin family metalloprotease [Patescibacteria group bacterium]MDE1946274.1 matrixin family metalloprotease [Patescibacteria group bacterium]MDE2232610.1 matrixin family metalloprotease [Patescibacteria group bacterium]